MNEWKETKINAQAKIEQDIMRYALVYLHANWEEADAEDLGIDELVLDGTLRRLIKNKGEEI